MTSPLTDELTRKFFECHRYFGLEADQVTFFQQGMIPCVSRDGRFIMETLYIVAKSPDGNGGVYSALKSSKLLEDMATRSIKYLIVGISRGKDTSLLYYRNREEGGEYIARRRRCYFASGRWLFWFISLSAADYPLVTKDDLLHTFSSLPRDLNFVDHTSDISWERVPES